MARARCSGRNWFNLRHLRACAGGYRGLSPAAAFGLLAIAYFASPSLVRRPPARVVAVTVPNPSLTPGATVLVGREKYAGIKHEEQGRPVALQRRVFDEYGIQSAAPAAYEVDYLITPALGGADDIHNLWPQAYTATVWNAQVKDALEDHLRSLVCDGAAGFGHRPTRNRNQLD